VNRFLTKVYLLAGGVLLAIIFLGLLLHRTSRGFAYTHLRVGHATQQLEAVLDVSGAFQHYARVRSQLPAPADLAADEDLTAASQRLERALRGLRAATHVEDQFIAESSAASPDEGEQRLAAEDALLATVEALTAVILAFPGRTGEPLPPEPLRRLEQTLNHWVEVERGERDRASAAGSALAARVSPVASTAAVAAFLLVVVGLVLTVPQIHRSLSHLLAGCTRVSGGDFAARIPEKGDAEFAALAVAFNRMASNLQEILRRELAATERAARAEAQSQASKMTAIGQLASGVAHEINNPLGVILGFAQGMERRVKEPDPLRLPVTSIVREALRCKSLVQELLTFARSGKKTVEPVQLNRLVKDSSVLLESRAKTQSVRVEHELTPEVPVVVANQSQLQQIIVNLGTNALDAMAGGGVLTLRTRTLGGSACLEIADTGSGIPPEIRDRIFDPFFTTKEPGKGTGLGLSLVHEIVQQHGGHIDVDSQAGKGTTMSVILPCRRPTEEVVSA
jgi:signal transduction histidine kinase